jgi:hypothetical protein
MAEWLLKLKPKTLPCCCALLALAVAVAFPVVAAMAYQWYGAAGVFAAAVAAIVCWAAATLALVCTALLQGPQAALYAMLFGMLFRMGLPLGIGLVLSRTSPVLAGAGVFGFIVVFYLVTLVVETLLSLTFVKRETAAGAR